MFTKTETWLDVMPAIPLARGVPVRSTTMRDYGGFVTWVEEYRGGQQPRHPAFNVMWDGYSVPEAHSRDMREGIRVDLADRQGFGYALWRLFERVNELSRTAVGPAAVRVMDLIAWCKDQAVRALMGSTTDADRLALARAHAEVTCG